MTHLNWQAEPLGSFALWALDELGIDAVKSAGLYRVRIPEQRELEFGGKREFTFATGDNGAPSDSADVLEFDSPLLGYLCDALHKSGDVVHARPRRQPVSVHELSDRLFAAYEFEGEGTVHLGGCSLEDQPFLRLTYGRTGDELAHIYFAADGSPAEQELIDDLGLDQVVAYGPAPPRPAEAAVHRLLTTAKSLAAKETTLADEPLAAALVWCKHAEGKLVFQFGDSTAEVAFAGWARSLDAPPLECPETGDASFHIGVTDDGHVAPCEAIGKCEESGKRVLSSNLVRCAASGCRILVELAEVCPVSGEHVLENRLVRCKVCRSRVSPQTLSGGVCRACRGLGKVTKDEPRMARLLGEYPRLDEWPRWKMSETATVYIAVGSTLVKQLLIVLDKDTLEPTYLATGSRLFPGWTPVPATEYERLLQ